MIVNPKNQFDWLTKRQIGVVIGMVVLSETIRSQNPRREELLGWWGIESTQRDAGGHNRGDHRENRNIPYVL